jgi:hypothetical protein
MFLVLVDNSMGEAGLEMFQCSHVESEVGSYGDVMEQGSGRRFFIAFHASVFFNGFVRISGWTDGLAAFEASPGVNVGGSVPYIEVNDGFQFQGFSF